MCIQNTETHKGRKMAFIIDGKKISSEIKDELKEKVAEYKKMV